MRVCRGCRACRASAFTGQAFHRVAQQVTERELEQAQVAIAKAAVARFELSTDVLAFDTTNFDTHIATTTPGELARRGHAKSKRKRSAGGRAGRLVSETGHVPLLYRTYPGNGSDQAVLAACLGGLARVARGTRRRRGSRARRRSARWCATVDSGARSWSWIWTPPATTASSRCRSGTRAAEEALQMAAQRGRDEAARRASSAEVRAARIRLTVGELDRTLVVVESQELLAGQKRGIAVALRKAKEELRKLERLVDAGRISRSRLEQRVKKALRARTPVELRGDHHRRHRAERRRCSWHVDAASAASWRQTRLGRRVLCTDRHSWSTGRIVHAFRGQWNVEELFRRAKKGGVVPWGPSHQWADGSLRLHTFATVLGLMLVSLAKIALGTTGSSHRMMDDSPPSARPWCARRLAAAAGPR